MKKIFKKVAFVFVLSAVPLIAVAATFNSSQVGSTPVNGYYLQTNGSTSTWMPVSGVGVGWASTTANIQSIYMYGTGNVGVGTSTPFGKLSVSGTTPRILLSDMTAGTGLKNWYMQSNAGHFVLNIMNDSYVDPLNSAFEIDQSGNVGINLPIASAYTEKLEVNGNVALSPGGARSIFVKQQLIAGAGDSLTISSASGKQFIGGDYDGGALTLSSGSAVGTNTNTGGQITITAGNSTNTIGPNVVINPGSGTTAGNILLGSVRGNVGIGTTSPYAKLSVAGQTVSGYFTATSTTVASTFPYASTTALSATRWAYVGTTAGGVAIGTTTPFASHLSLKSDSTGTARNTIISDSNDRMLFQVLDNGKVKIGSSTAATTLFDVDGVISSGADGNIGGGELRSYQIPGFYLSLKTDTTLNKSGLLRSNASGSKYIIDYNTGNGDTEINGAFSASGNIIFSNIDVETGRIRNGLWSIGASKFPAATLDITQPAISTAKTASYDAIKSSNTATSSTASVIMSGIETVVTGTNSGTSAKNIGVYVSSVSGGTENYDGIFNGTAKVGIGTTSPATNLVVQGYTQSVIASGVATSTCNTAIEGSQVYNLGNHHLWLCMGSEPWTLLK